LVHKNWTSRTPLIIFQSLHQIWTNELALFELGYRSDRKQSTTWDGAESARVRRRRLFRRQHWRYKLTHDIAHLPSHLARSIAGAKEDGGVHGGPVVRIDGEPSTATETTKSKVTPRFTIPKQL